MSLRPFPLAISILCASGAFPALAAAQVAPDPAATVTPDTSVLPPPIIVPLPVISPAPVAPLPAPRETPRAAATPAPTPATTPTPAVTPTPRASVTPASVPTASPTPTPTPTASAVAAIPIPAPSTVPPDTGWGWGLPLALGALTAVFAGLWLFRRRRVDVSGEDQAGVPPVADVEVVRSVPIVPPEHGRAWLTITLQPRRGGVNLLTATLDVEVVVHNEGTRAATDIRLDLRLLSAHAGQDDDIAATFADAAARPAAPLFALEPGDRRTIDALLTLPRTAIHVLDAGGRPMFVPVVTAGVRYDAGHSAAAWAVGVAREAGAKLAPFWLDAPGRMQESLAVRPLDPAVRR